jgi:uncharacterized protein YvpB
MAKTLNVEFISQNDSSVPEGWSDRSCAIVCLKMCLDFYGTKKLLVMPRIPALIKEGSAMLGDQYNPKVGWKHDSLVWLAHNHGVPAYKEEFRSDEINLETREFSPSVFSEDLIKIGMNRIKESIEKEIPVIVSLLPGFGSVSNFHLLVIIGYDDKGFVVHDPSDSKPKESFHIPIKDFLKYWRKYAIFVG